MNKKTKIILYGLIVIISFFQTIQASQYAPNIYFFTPSKDEPFLLNSSIGYSAGFANRAFDENGTSVPFLQQYGNEDFLERFVDPSIGLGNTEIVGHGLFSGKFHFQQYRFLCEKNIHHKLLLGGEFSLQDLSITNISAEFIPEEYPLSPERIAYLEQLQQIIPKDIHQSGLFTAILYLSYNEKLTDFNHIDFFQATLLAAISTPQSMSDDNESILQFPCSANYFFGYPIIGTMLVGIREWVGLGFYGLVVPFQPLTTTIAVNQGETNNNLLYSQSTQAKINQDPFISGTVYLQINRPQKGLTGTLAYTYSEYLNSSIIPIGSSEFHETNSHKSILLDGYSLGALLLQLEIDCSSDEKKVAPIISMFFSAPIVGKFFPQIYLFGGQCNFQISYNF